ncbi:hypothetical protein C8P68_107177 [Mucilaginibacter yixingensis]|uniref:Uncharacterized protein n=1 Tax=Mucilaginibacter yixingensis TaxID=1295612 RepID=A0A2T5J6E3_9SPHI|nr:hypothetical protein [Mucilaginibacter yixingensis]PTQ94112.1 hypothetical protein C8P68_107177 [Mucilaginibacter yixingensis]
MIYFKKIQTSAADQRQLEQALRKMALKRTRPLDLYVSSTDIGTDKYFHGFEGKNGVQFTRIRSSLERLVPKLIIKIPQDPGANYYQVRLGAVSLFYLLIFILPIAAIVHNIMINPADGDYNFIWVLFLYIGLFYLEYRLTTSRVEKAISKYKEASA